MEMYQVVLRLICAIDSKMLGVETVSQGTLLMFGVSQRTLPTIQCCM